MFVRALIVSHTTSGKCSRGTPAFFAHGRFMTCTGFSQGGGAPGPWESQRWALGGGSRLFYANYAAVRCIGDFMAEKRPPGGRRGSDFGKNGAGSCASRAALSGGEASGAWPESSRALPRAARRWVRWAGSDEIFGGGPRRQRCGFR